MPMISVIIPTLNEETHIAAVVNFAKNQPNVSEVIVVDDKSSDQTVAIAIENGAKVITSTKLGKGASMKDGILYATNEIVVFLDGDIDPYPPDTVKILSDPIICGEADFVKSSFSRNAGRVTELVAKPLLSIFYPELLRHGQPLSGMIAGKRSLLKRLDLREDYGVDIGILIDMHLMKVRVADVEIGYIENKSKPWQELGKMSKEVSQAIISKGTSTKKPPYLVEVPGTHKEILSQMEYAVKDHLRKHKKLVIFDMDNTLLRGRFIDACANSFGFMDKLMELRATEPNGICMTKQVVKLLKGKSVADLISVADNIPIVEDAQVVIFELKKRGYIVGIISDSYDCITEHIKNKLEMDFSLANELEFSKSICTGEVKIPSFFFSSSDSLCKHSLCKTNAMMGILNKYQIKKENCITIGDSLNDLCMIKEAGIGIAFCPDDELLKLHADATISTPGFAELLTHASKLDSKNQAATKVKKLVSIVSRRGHNILQILSNAIRRTLKNKKPPTSGLSKTAAERI